MKIKEIGQKGFTMIELMIAMAIFVMFVGVVINSYASIVYSQRDTNEYRQVYSEARQFFDVIVAELRDSVLYYGENITTEFNNSTDAITLVSKDGKRVISFENVDGDIIFKENINCGQEKNTYQINSNDVRIADLNFYVTPAFDPYLLDNVSYNSLQFQPKVTIYVAFEKDRAGKDSAPYSVDFQTTISSRYYSQVPEVNFTCLP